MSTLREKYLKIIYKKNLDWLKLDVKFNIKEIQRELENYHKNYIDQSKTGWNGLSYRGISLEKVRPFVNYGYKAEDDVPYKWTDMADQCPTLRKEIISHFPSEKYYRVKINSLDPGGHIPPHSDSLKNGLGLTDHSPYTDKNAYQVKYITLPIFWPKETEYYVNKKTITFNDGDTFLVNFHKTHEVYNKSNKVRISAIITLKAETERWWMELVCRSYKKYKDKADIRKKMRLSFYMETRAEYFKNKLKNKIKTKKK
jgi:hypothetical protein